MEIGDNVESDPHPLIISMKQEMVEGIKGRGEEGRE